MALEYSVLDGSVNKVRAFLLGYQHLLAFSHQVMNEMGHSGSGTLVVKSSVFQAVLHSPLDKD